MQRRRFNQSLVTALTSVLASASIPHSVAQSAPRVVVIGGGFGGLTVARSLRQLLPDAHITLVERNPTYTACPFSNLVVAGERSLAKQQFNYTVARQLGIHVHIASATDIDPTAHTVTLDSGDTLPYDRLVVSPGIQLNYSGLEGYSVEAADKMPHAWLAGTQTTLLAKRLQAVPAGGLVVIAAPANPFRCPPGPYERASLMAHYLKQHNPTAKLLILDAKDKFSKQPLFQQAWQQHYGNMIEWQGSSDGARVRRVDAARGEVETDFDRYQPDLANIIPPQQAAPIAQQAGLTDASGWCPIDAMTFASTLQPDIHVLGDACIANAMPKSAFAANAQGKICALQIARALSGLAPVSTKLINTCYSLLNPQQGISVAGVYTAQGQRFIEVPGAGGVSDPQATPGTRQLEAQYAYSWFKTLTQAVFG